MKILGWKIPWRIGKVKRTPKLTSLPYEVLTKVLEKLSADDICKLMLSQSDDLLPSVRRYHESRQFRNRFLQRAGAMVGDWEAVGKFFASQGRLVRVLMMNSSVEETIDYVLDFFRVTHTGIKYYTGWSSFFSEALRRCSQPEFYDFLVDFSHEHLIQLAEVALHSEKPVPEEEMHLRHMMIGCFLEGLPMDSPHFRFRLSALARVLAFQKEHRVIRLLGAPIRDQQIDYTSVVNDAIGDAQAAREVLGEMPNLVEQLLRTSTLEVKQARWTEVQVFNLIEMLTTDPEPWVLINFSALLVSSPRLADVAIVNRARYSNTQDVWAVVTSCVEACVHLDLDPKNVLYEATRNLSDALLDICASAFQAGRP